MTLLTLLAFVEISRNRNIMKTGEMKHEMTLFHTMGPNRNFLFQTQLIYGLEWSSFNIR